ncbi:hypothetical protein J4U01_gp043 [Mycobacterium phage Kumao]|uniref:Uncharacterized protein n=1 Tax=Mycobacterium phage Kumao TaxID=2041344 RepID=A0A2D1GPN2_9CAUD|nr:hypothetical protein J4U01_gp043 [Mycobacterium phage Kumao]ATN94006.1 hypothetical protein SEA_KUMAO_43 [Mycobacterium phage Kumao]
MPNMDYNHVKFWIGGRLTGEEIG